jgi:hypothetical protein
MRIIALLKRDPHHWWPSKVQQINQTSAPTKVVMPPKKKQDAEDLGDMRAARFGRVKNTLSMGFGE